MGLYETERDKISRTPQILCKVGMTSCENFYATLVKQLLQYTEDFSNAIWTKSGTTVTPNDPISTAPDTTVTADIITAAAPNDYVEQVATGYAAASGTFVFSCFIATRAGSGNVTLQIRDSTGSEIGSVVHTPSSTWTRVSVAFQFSGAATGDVRVRIIKASAAGAADLFWGANLTKNPTNNGALALFPYVKRVAEADTVLSVNASRCQAVDAGVGSRCTYSDPTCQDKANINLGNTWKYATNATFPLMSSGDPKNGIKEFAFCLNDAPLPVVGADIWPMLKSAVITPQKIDPEKSITESETVKLEFYDDATRANWNQDKAGLGALTNTGVPSATFWRRFLPIYLNYSNPRNYVTVNVGFVASGAVETDYKQRGKYLVTNLEIDGDGRVTMSLIDRLHLLRTKAPAKISEGNLLNGAINSAVTTGIVDDASELTPPAANAATAETYGTLIGVPTYGKRTAGPDYVVTIQIADDPAFTANAEFLNVTGISGNTMTWQRGRWGTSAVSHGDNSFWREVLMFGTERTTPSLAPLGKNAMDIAYQLLARGGLSLYDDVDTATLNSQQSDWMQSEVHPSTGIQTGRYVFQRAGNTIDAGNGGIATQTDIEKLMTQIREASMLSLLTGEDQKVTGHVFAPVSPSVTLIELTDGENLLKGSIEINDNKESRFNVILVGYDLAAGADGSKLADYQKVLGRADADGLAASAYGDRRTRIILSPWIRSSDAATASTLAVHMLGRFKNAARKVKGNLEVKDDALKCGDFALLTTARLVRPDGAIDSRIVEVQSKGRDAETHVLSVTLQDTGLVNAGGLAKRYMFIAPAGTPDYDSATTNQKRYGFIGAALTNKVGALKEDGYFIW